MFAGFGSAEDTNARFRQLLDAGQTGLSIAYDMPTLYGYDTDDAGGRGRVRDVRRGREQPRRHGAAARRAAARPGQHLDDDQLARRRRSGRCTSRRPRRPGCRAAALEGTTQNDILKEYVAQKEFLFPPEPSMRLVVDTIEFGTRELPRWNTVSISGYHIREAGSTAVQELAFTIADGMAYVEAAMARGLRVDDFAPRLSFFFNSHSDFFEEIAKFRASRRIWWKLMSERYRAENERSTWMRFHTQTAGVSLTPQQPLNNLTRVATQALAAILGGTQSLHTDAYDEALAVPTAEAALLALRQQQVMLEETGVASTVDPLGGSWFVEALTNRVEREVWRYLDEIDRRGGMVAAIAEGYPQREIADARLPVPARVRRGRAGDRRRQRLHQRRAGHGAGARGAPRARWSGTWPASSGPAPSATTRRSRPRSTGCARRRRGRDRARPTSCPTSSAARSAYATLGEQCRVLREVFGEYREPVAV